MPHPEIPIIEQGDNLALSIEEALKTIQGSTAHANDRNRPYDGQSWTDDGVRGQTQVQGLTMRDVVDCFVQAVLHSATTPTYLQNFHRCWDISTDEQGKPVQKPTPFLLERINDPDYIAAKADLGIWINDDLFRVQQKDVLFMAVAQNLVCQLEKMMGIFPNIDLNPLLNEDEDHE